LIAGILHLREVQMTILGIPIELYAAYVLACTAVVIVPGPSVTVIIANSLRHGVKAGLLNVAGTQVGLAIMLLILAAGLQFIVESLVQVFDIIRWIGAAYLIWLGVKLLRSDGTMGEVSDVPRANGSFFWQGFLVVLSNPKALFFFGALIPQFLTSGGNALAQTVLWVPRSLPWPRRWTPAMHCWRAAPASGCHAPVSGRWKLAAAFA
jgi:homoserine/homoserine lactone efflux protein